MGHVNSVGGVAGALCLLFLVAFLVNYFAKRQRRRERDLWSRRLLRQDGYTWTADDDEEGSALVSMPYNDMLTGGEKQEILLLTCTSSAD